MAANSDNIEWVVDIDTVREALAILKSAPIHPAFAGYLAIKREARYAEKLVKLKPNFRRFFQDFLHVGGGPTPYLLPFTESPSEPAKWFNRNVAGSYAPSSLRPQSPLSKLSTVKGSGATATYSLKDDHCFIATERLAFNKPISVAALAAFLYRDYSIPSQSGTVADVIQIFRNEFGYRTENEDEQAEYEQLFTDDPQSLEERKLVRYSSGN